MDPMAEIKASFFVECAELLEGLEEGLLQLQDGDEDPETVNAVFRAVHSIKGGAGAFGLEALVHFAHRFETVLDEVRADRLTLTQDAILLFLKAADVLSDHVTAAREETSVPSGKSDNTIQELEALLDIDANESNLPEAEVVADFSPMMLSLDLPQNDAIPPIGTQFRFITREGLVESGNEPLFLMRALAELAPFQAEIDTARLPDFDNLSPSKTYVDWTLKSNEHVDQSDIEAVFEFATDLCEIVFEEQTQIDFQNNPQIVHPPQTEHRETEQQDPQIVTDSEAIEPSKTITINEATKPKNLPKQPVSTATVRVGLDRVDRLVNLVGELVINQAMLSQSLSEIGLVSNTSVASGLEEFQQLTRDIQDSVMAIRAQPVKPLFQRMSRIVREAAEDTQKKVRLYVEGENTEIDKTVIERLADPLTHMIRNAVDHGLEKPQTRKQVGKTEEGTVVLRASHRSGRVVIEIEDDGAGINRPRVLKIAQDKGLIPEDANLSETEIDNLLFMPGFSTAKEISNLSGRGVGMDVVKRAIQSLGGRISIQSTPGQGSVFSISLPLTLAVLDGMVIEVAGQTMVVPLSSIVETLTLAEADVQILDQGTRIVQIRGSFVPLLDLAEEFGYRDAGAYPENAVVLFILAEDGERYALVVDLIQEQRQVVIKGLAETYGHVPGVAAATILGDGKIALILDTADLIGNAGHTDQNKLSLAG